jgi:putative membrane protein
MLGFWARFFVTALGLAVSALMLSGIEFRGLLALALASLVLGFVNAGIRPLLIVLTFPFTVVTLGLFLLVVNAAMLGLSAWLVPGFTVTGFWSAFFGAIIVSVTSTIASWYIGPKGNVEVLIIKNS